MQVFLLISYEFYANSIRVFAIDLIIGILNLSDKFYLNSKYRQNPITSNKVIRLTILRTHTKLTTLTGLN